MPSKVQIVDGDLLDQRVDVIVNAWNRNIIPWWLLVPQGVSGAIKRRGGYQPFIELGYRPIPLGGARRTGPGKLTCRAIIHVAGINMLWCATEYSIKQSVRSAMRIVNEHKYRSVAFPIIGGGTGGTAEDRALAWMLDAFAEIDTISQVTVVRFNKR
jgi:O-acetyl-ADP-ribose deacetylase (regulator of RNase III)